MEQKENKMGVMPVNQLLITMSLPMIISMLVQACYNIIDSIFVAKIDYALTAVSLAFPIQSLMIAVSVGTCVGINAMLSRSLGEKDFKKANLTAENGVFLALISYVIFALFGLFFSHTFFVSQAKGLDPIVITYGTSYLSICTIFSFGMFFQITFDRIIQSTGRTIFNMITQLTGALINIILDPILIFGLFGFPKLGIAGAAIATVIGQIVGMILSIYFNATKNKEVKMSFKQFRPSKHIIFGIYSVGIPSILMQSITSIMTFGMNKILLLFSHTAVDVFGIYFKLQSFIFMPVFGLNNGMVPIIAYNYGARNKKRIIQVIKLSILYAIAIMLIGFGIFQLFTEQLLMLFKAKSEMIDIGVIALRTISFSFIFAGFCIIVTSVFQALGNGMLSLIVSIARQLLIILPVAYFFAVKFGLNAVWYSFPIAELVSVVLSSVFMLYTYQTKIRPME